MKAIITTTDASGGTATTSGFAGPRAVQAKFDETARMVGALSPAMQGVLRYRFNDLGDFHRKTVAKRLYGVGARGLARQVFGRYRRLVYVKPETEAARIPGTAAEFVIFSAPTDDGTGRWENLEKGKRITSSRFMLIPWRGVAAVSGTAARKATKRDLELLQKGELARIPLPNGKILLARVTGQSRRGKAFAGLTTLGKTKPIAILSKTRTQRPILAFEASWAKVVNDPRTVAKWDADLTRVMDAAGAAALLARDRRTTDRIAAKAAERAAKADPLAPGGVA